MKLSIKKKKTICAGTRRMSNGTFSVQIRKYHSGRPLHSYRCVFPGSHCFPFRLLNKKANTQSFSFHFTFLHGAAGQLIVGAPSPKQVKIARVFRAASYFWIGATEVYIHARAPNKTLLRGAYSGHSYRHGEPQNKPSPSMVAPAYVSEQTTYTYHISRNTWGLRISLRTAHCSKPFYVFPRTSSRMFVEIRGEIRGKHLEWPRAC